MITVTKEDFLKAIKAVKTVTTRQAIQPVLQTINLKTENGGLTLTATDGTQTAKISIEANATNQINICINAEKLEAIVSKLDEIITIEIEGATAIIRSGKAKFRCLYIEGSEFPNIEIKLEGEKIVLLKNNFIDGVNKTCFATQNDNTQNILNGIHFKFDNNIYEMAATDGNRLSQVQFEYITGNNKDYTIPKQALLNILKNVNEEIEIYFTEKKVVFRTENFVYQTYVLNGKYPQYSQLIPKQFNYIIPIDKTEFINVLDKVSIMANERTNIVKMIFKNNELQFQTNGDMGEAKDSIEIDYTDEEMVIGFNYHYLIEGIKAMMSDVINFNINSNQQAILITGDYNYLVMPVKL